MFDSGVGGLTVLRALAEALPRERFLYLGDTARLPYGTKSARDGRALRAAGGRRTGGARHQVPGRGLQYRVWPPHCAAMRDRYEDLPLIGVIEPGAAAACAASASGRIAVLATEGTVRGGAYQQAIAQRRPEAAVTALACPLFVALAEEGWVDWRRCPRRRRSATWNRCGASAHPRRIRWCSAARIFRCCARRSPRSWVRASRSSIRRRRPRASRPGDWRSSDCWRSGAGGIRLSRHRRRRAFRARGQRIPRTRDCAG